MRILVSFVQPTFYLASSISIWLFPIQKWSFLPWNFTSHFLFVLSQIPTFLLLFYLVHLILPTLPLFSDHFLIWIVQSNPIGNRTILFLNLQTSIQLEEFWFIFNSFTFVAALPLESFCYWSCLVEIGSSYVLLLRREKKNEKWFLVSQEVNNVTKPVRLEKWTGKFVIPCETNHK